MSRNTFFRSDAESDADLLEQHVLASSRDTVPARLRHFRRRNPQLIRMTDTVVAILRTRLYATPDETARSLAQLKATWRGPDHLVTPTRSSLPNPISPFIRSLRSTPVAVGTMMAMVLLVLGIGGVWTQHSQNVVRDQRHQFSTTNAQRATVELPDGSRVVLGARSQITLGGDYSRGNRTVYLSGEALFTVAATPNAPFTVHTEQTATRVLGTTFAVRQYDTEPSATITVRDGKVMVVSPTDSVVLAGGEQATLRATNVFAVQPVTPERFDFANGRLSFAGTALRDAIPELDRWFDVEIHLSDRARAARLDLRQIRGTITSTSASELAGILELAFDVHVIRQGKRLTLDPK